MSRIGVGVGSASSGGGGGGGSDVDKTTNEFHVKDYGALGDGGTDDTAAILAANTAAIANEGGIVVLGAGIYPVSGSISLGPNVSIKGISPNLSILKNSNGSTAYSLLTFDNNNNNRSISDLSIDLNGSSGAIVGIDLATVNNIKIDNVVISNANNVSGAYGLKLNNSNNTTLNNINIDTLDYGIFIYNSSNVQGVNLTSNYCTTIGMSILSSQYVQLKNCEVNNGGSIGLTVSNCSNVMVDGTFKTNTYKDIQDNGSNGRTCIISAFYDTLDFQGSATEYIKIVDLQSQLQNQHYYTPEQFGAVGDGATDDTNAVAQALSAAGNQNNNLGGVVLLGPKTYLVGNGNVTLGLNVGLWGSGKRTSIIMLGGGYAVYSVNDGISVKDMTIDRIFSDEQISDCIQISGSTDVTIENVCLKHGLIGLHLVHCNHVSLVGVDLLQGTQGLYIDGASSAIMGTNIMAASNTNEGVYVTSSGGAVYGLALKLVTSSNGVGVKIVGSTGSGNVIQQISVVDTVAKIIDSLVNVIDLSVPVSNTSCFNVEDFGAVGDGSTDDYAAILAASTAAALVKGTVIFGPKVYAITDTVAGATMSIPSNCNWKGAGTGRTTLLMSNMFFDATGGNNIIEDIKFDGNNTAPTYLSIGPDSVVRNIEHVNCSGSFSASFCSNILIQNVKVDNNQYGDGINFSQVEHVTMTGVVVKNCLGYGLYLSGNCKNNVFEFASDTNIGPFRDDATIGYNTVVRFTSHGDQNPALATGEVHFTQMDADHRFIGATQHTSGSSFTTGQNTRLIKTRLVGGGGAGGGAASVAVSAAAGGGGGSGGYCESQYIVSPNTSYSYTIGSGGTGGSGDGGDGSDSTLTIGIYVDTVGGGKGGKSGGTAAATPLTSLGGAGGTNSGGNIWSGNGNPGNSGIRLSGTIAVSGSGGNSLLGGGGNSVNTSLNGIPGDPSRNGSGGGGACTVNGAAAKNGGDGSGGVLIVEEYT